MLGRDQTGPLGMGPVDGRGMEYCEENAKAVFSDCCFERRFSGSGVRCENRGFRGGAQPAEYYPPSSPASPAEREANTLKEELRRIARRSRNRRLRI